MPLSTTGMGIAITDVTVAGTPQDGEPQVPLGFEVQDGFGRTWIYVQCAALTVVGEVQSRIAGATPAIQLGATVVCPASVNPQRALGVCQHVIGLGQCGFILRNGEGLLNGTYVALAALTIGAAAGEGVAAAAGLSAFAISMTCNAVR